MSAELRARYEAAEQLLPHNLRKLIRNARVRPTWIPGTDSFWYRRANTAGHEYVLVDAATRAVAVDSHPPVAPAVAPAVGELASPDGRWIVGLAEHNLYLRDTATGQQRMLTTDGEPARSYGTNPDSLGLRVMQDNLGISLPPLLRWSADSTRFVTHRIDQRELALMHLVRSAPPGGGRPEPMTYRYPVVGDEHTASAELLIVDAATRVIVTAKLEPIHVAYGSPIMMGKVWWDADDRRIHLLANTRGDRSGSLVTIDAETGVASTRVEESSTTAVQFGATFMDNEVRSLASGEVLWWSERDGWGHLYLYAADGGCRQITMGDWLVRKVVHVDESARTVTFTAAGRESGLDPYVQQLYRASLDSGELTRLTEDALDHDVVASPDGSYLVDVACLLEVPSVTTLRDRDGTVLIELERADVAELYAAGYTDPERVVVKAADGVTDICCALYKPHGFDERARYPVLDEVYPGPQTGALPQRFPESGGPRWAASFGPSFAALGFVVVVVEGRGTPLRSREFAEHMRTSGSDFIDDHVTAIQQLAADRPWMDLERVGIFGTSGGGFASTKALLLRPDIYSVAVSAAGDHDDRIYHASWGERFFGMNHEFDYASHVNPVHAAKLEGRLLLIHGEMDDNVTPHQTMRLVDALIAANKDFDLLIVPNADHSLQVHQGYWLRRRWDYFVTHLMGEQPPAYCITDPPMDFEALAESLR